MKKKTKIIIVLIIVVLIGTIFYIYEIDDNGFRFYSPKYKFGGNNIINLIIKNKKTNVEYTKRLKVSTGTAL